MAVAGPLGLTLTTQAVRSAPAAVWPRSSTALVRASLPGRLAWSDAPVARTYAGAALIIAGGTVPGLRERPSKG
jgi:hypothetical protein